MLRVARQSRVMDGRDVGVRQQSARELGRRRLGSVEPDGQRPQAAQREEGLEAAGDRPVVVAIRGQDVGVRTFPTDGRPQQQVRVAADHLRRRVQDDVGAKDERPLAQRRRERGVHDGHRAALARARGDRGDVGHHHEGVGDRLDPDEVGAVGCGQDGRGVIRRGHPELEAPSRLEPLEDVADPVVRDGGQHHDAARRHEVGDRRRRGEARRERDGLAAVKRAERRLQRTPTRIAVAPVLDGGVVDVRGTHGDGCVHGGTGHARGPAGLDRHGVGGPARLQTHGLGIRRFGHAWRSFRPGAMRGRRSSSAEGSILGDDLGAVGLVVADHHTLDRFGEPLIAGAWGRAASDPARLCHDRDQLGRGVPEPCRKLSRAEGSRQRTHGRILAGRPPRVNGWRSAVMTPRATLVPAVLKGP